MYNIRSELGLTQIDCPRFSTVSDVELVSVVSEVKQEFPDIGQTMLKGILESKGIYVPTSRLCDCLSDALRGHYLSEEEFTLYHMLTHYGTLMETTN